MKKSILFTLLFNVFLKLSFSQFSEQFTDGDFTNNPEWNGDVTHFSIYNSTAVPSNLRPSLRLTGNSAGDISHLYSLLNLTLNQEIEWKFWIKISFNPTSNNFARFYLLSDNSNLEGPLNGYYVSIGETGDKVSLVKQSGTSTNEIIVGTVANLNVSSSAIYVKVTRDVGGNWKLYTDLTNGTAYQLEGTVNDVTFTSGICLGLYCKYTSSNYQNFYWDEIFVNYILPDTEPPTVSNLTIVSSNSLDIVFSENVELTSSQNILNYFVDNGIGNPITATRDAINFSKVRLTFSNSFVDGESYNLTISNISDLNGNVMTTPIQLGFDYYSVPSIINETFDDGDFTNNPQWTGSLNDFVILNGRLKLNASVAGTSYLSTKVAPNYDSIEWRFYVNCLFSPSTSNYLKLYLISDNENLTQPLNGYFLKFGETGSTDALELYKQNGTTTSLLGRGTTGSFATNPNANIKVVRNNITGEWKVYVDTLGGENFSLQFVANDLTYNYPVFSLGMVCVYTSSNIGNFYFDNIYCGPVIIDLIPPQLSQIQVISSNTVDVIFNEPVEQTSAENVLNYSGSNGLGHPLSAIRNTSDWRKVRLTFPSNFVPNLTYSLAVTGIKDLSGNTMILNTMPFIYYISNTVIEESFTDGDFTNNPTWTGTDTSFIVNADKQLQLKTVNAGNAYLSTELTPTSDSLEWQVWIKCTFDPSSSNYPRFYLMADNSNLLSSLNGYYIKFGETGSLDAIQLFKQTGTSSSLILRGTDGMVASSPIVRVKVKFNRLTGEWQLYADYTGGNDFIFEGTNTDISYNFSAFYVGPVCTFTSSNTTKFFFDDIYAGPVKLDTIGPRIVDVIPTSAYTLDVYFSENVEANSAENINNYSVNNGIGNPVLASKNLNNNNLVHLTFANTFSPSINYTLNTFSISDLIGNQTSFDSYNFTYIPSPPFIDEHFDDGDFTQNPTWSGNTTDFIVTTDKKLQLKNTVSSISYLSTSVNPIVDSLEWQFFVNMNFDPSASNYMKFYLMSDKANLNGSLNGYFIKIGENGSLDAIELYKQSGTTTTLLGRGTNATVCTSPSVKVKVIYNKLTGVWRVYYAPVSSDNYILDFTTQENTYNFLTFNIGMVCVYTSSNASKFIFDDIYAGPVIIDSIPPYVTNVMITGDNSISIVFNEILEINSAEDELNYTVNQSMGTPTNATIDPESKNIVNLVFNNNFVDNQVYKLTCKNISDENGNAIDSITYTFTYKAIPSFIYDDFSDWEFFNNPSWNGDIGAFIVNDKLQLQLYTSGSGSSYLSTPVKINKDSIEWQFWLFLNFDPSSSNYVKYYLYANQADLKKVTKGYFLRIGESGANDAIELYYQNGNENILLARASDGAFSSKPVARIKIKRNLLNGQWKIFSDMNGETNFNQIAECIDTSYKPLLFYVGMLCNYSSTYSEKFFFDDIYVGPVIKDTIPPYIKEIIPTGNSSIDVVFSENVELSSSQLITNYSVNNNIGIPVLAQRDSINKSIVHLEFGSIFQSEVIYTLTVQNISDMEGNTATILMKTFSVYNPKEFDIVINEIMADVDPVPISLPNADYIELYNRTNYPVRLVNWTIKPRTSANDLLIPPVTIEPQGYVILTEDERAGDFSNFGKTLGINGLYMNNEGTVILKNSLGEIIHSVTYEDTWYKDNVKKMGGWSLEMIDPFNPCGEINNWKASEDNSGGTPGRKNSVFASNPDIQAPSVINVLAKTEDSVEVYFSESIKQTTLEDPSAYTIDNNIGNPTAVTIYPPNFNRAVLKLSTPLQRKVVYTLTVSDQIKDCSGNSLSANNNMKFALPEIPEAGDIIINEILFNPPTGGADFVEIYNNSQKIIDLKSVKISNFDTITFELKNIKNITTIGKLIFPGEYYVLSSDTGWVKRKYYTPSPHNFINMSLPSFPDNVGTVCILRDSSNILDRLVYYKNWHFPLLKNNAEGVSLERLDFNRATQNKENWHSAAESVGFATPAYKNSQYKVSETISGTITLDPEIFSPDNDGYNDVINIIYHFDNPGNVANVVIYDKNGRKIKVLRKNELLSNDGIITWDGIDENNEKARIGIYILYFEVFDVAGNTRIFKENFVVAGKMKN